LDKDVTKRKPTTHGVLIAGVHLTYPSRSAANRVRRSLRAYLVALPRASRADIEAVAKLAARMIGHDAADIAAYAAGRHLPGRAVTDQARAVVRGAMLKGLSMAIREKLQTKGKRKPCR
jgi:hypothetical protein